MDLAIKYVQRSRISSFGGWGALIYVAAQFGDGGYAIAVSVLWAITLSLALYWHFRYKMWRQQGTYRQRPDGGIPLVFQMPREERTQMMDENDTMSAMTTRASVLTTLNEFRAWREIYEIFAEKFEQEYGPLSVHYDNPIAAKAKERVMLFNDVLILLRDELTAAAKTLLMAAGRPV